MNQFLGWSVGIVAIFITNAIHAEQPKDHLQAARAIIQGLDPSHNEYAYDDVYLHWKGADGAVQNEVRSDCSGFVSLIFEHVYCYSPDDMKKWFGHNRPLAKHYHDEIEAGHGFKQIKRVQDIQPGDLLAVKYADESKSTKDTGHVMIVAGDPKAHRPSAPLEGDSSQWEVEVIDCSKSGHGPQDTRRKPDKTYGTGAGEGTIRLYSNAAGEIVGYSWSTFAKSEFYPPEKHHLAVGRLEPGFKP